MSNGARSTGGSGSGGVATGGSSPIPQAGVPGSAGETSECPPTPIAGRWVARGPDPYGLELKNDGTQVVGQGCIGGFVASGDPPLFGCNPLTVLADKGRSFDFTWDAAPSIGGPYFMKMQLTLSPERNAMAGKLWSNYAGIDGDGIDIVFVPVPGEPTLPATTCSGGEPSGDCFLAPLRTDRVDDVRIVEVAGGDLLMLWLNQRGVGNRLVASRFDAASNAWQPAEFLDDDSASVASLQVSTSVDGWAMLAYTQGEELVTRSYSPKTKAWSKRRIVARETPAGVLRLGSLFVYDGGDALLIVGAQFIDHVGTVSAYDYSATTDAWTSAHTLEGSPENAFEWAAGSDAERRQLAVWVRGGSLDKPHEMWFSSRSWPGPWSEPAKFFSSPHQILRPAAAIGPAGNAVATWQEWTRGINSSSYSFENADWSETVMVTSETQQDNRVVRFDDAGAAVAYFHDNGPNGSGELKKVLADGAWGLPQACTELEVNGETYTLAAGKGDLDVEQVVPGKVARALPSLERPRCEGY